MNDNKIKIVICDDMPQILDYFKVIINHENDMMLVGSACSAKEGLEIIRKTKPDVVLMDIQLENSEAGIWATEQLSLSMPDVKVIIITIHEKDDLLFRAYVAGAVDYIVKTSSVTEIVDSIRNVFSNKIMLRPEIAKKIVSEFSRLKKREESLLYMLNIATTLTNAEVEILKLLETGKSRKEIAEDRFVEVETINKQISSMLKKYNYTNAKHLVKTLSEIGIMDIIKTKKR